MAGEARGFRVDCARDEAGVLQVSLPSRVSGMESSAAHCDAMGQPGTAGVFRFIEAELLSLDVRAP